jgi:hypothetical protein
MACDLRFGVVDVGIGSSPGRKTRRLLDRKFRSVLIVLRDQYFAGLVLDP